MRILTAPFHTAADFLAAYDASEGVLFYATRIPLLPGDPVILDVRMPVVAHPVLLRGRVRKIVADAGGGALVRIDPEDYATRDFLVGMARGEAPTAPALRRTSRFPLEIQVDWQVGGSEDLYVSSTDDVSWTGVFVRTFAPPPIGTEVSVVITTPGGEHLRIPGRVTRTSSERTTGMAVRFTDETEDRRRLRRLLRGMDLRGVLAFPL